MSYRIGSFNCLNFGLGYDKDFQVFADIIYNENLDVIALQEINRDPYLVPPVKLWKLFA